MPKCIYLLPSDRLIYIFTSMSSWTGISNEVASAYTLCTILPLILYSSFFLAWKIQQQSSIKINILMQFGNECQHTDMQTHTRTHAYAHTHTSKQGKWSCQTSNNFFLIAEFIVLSVLFIFLCSCNMSCQLFYSPRISLSCFLEAVWYTKMVVVAVHMKLSIQRPHQLLLFLVSVVSVYTTLVSLGSCVWHWIRRFWVFCSNFSSQVWFLLPTE